MMRTYLLQVTEGKADSVTIKGQATVITDWVDAAARELAIPQEQLPSIGSIAHTKATLYRELTSATAHTLIFAHLSAATDRLITRLDSIGTTFDQHPPAQVNANLVNQFDNRQQRQEVSRPASRLEQIRAECDEVRELFPTFFDEAVQMAEWITSELCLRFPDQSIEDVAAPWKTEVRQTFLGRIEEIEAERRKAID